MGVFAEDIADPARQLSDDLSPGGELLERVLDDIAEQTTDALEDVVRSATGDGRLSGVPERGAIRVKVTEHGTSRVIALEPAGTAALRFGDTRPHLIGGGGRGRRALRLSRTVQSRQRRRASQWRTGPVRHPGTRGHPGVDNVDRQLAEVAAEVAAEHLEDAWEG